MAQSMTSTRAMRSFLQRYSESVRTLPEPGEKWLACDENVSVAILTTLKKNGAIRKVGETYSTDAGEYVNYWITSEPVYKLAHSDMYTRSDTGILPCGHDAIKNERGVEGITCGVCDEIHDRSEIDL